MKPEQQRVLNENTLTLMERLMRRIETSEVRVTDVGMKTGSFAYGSVDAPQWGNDGTFVLTIATDCRIWSHDFAAAFFFASCLSDMMSSFFECRHISDFR